jgi:hypothetical protein
MHPTTIPASNRVARRPPSLWVIVFFLIVILLNIWVDYHHPAGILFDVAVVVIVLVRYLNKSNPA